MPLDTKRARQLLRDLDFRKLFIEELGWDRYAGRLDVMVDSRTFPLAAVAQKRGFQVFICEPGLGEQIPDYNTRRRIDHQVSKSAHEHLIIYVDPGRTTQVWQWVKREPGKPTRCREHTYHVEQPGDALIQKLQSLLFTFEEEEQIALIDVGIAVRKAFDVEKVTKRFYDRFKAEHDAFLKFLQGIPDEEMERWYASVMLNRLMFIYFIQKKGFLNNDTHYLTTQLARSKQRGKDRYYAGFLCPLFFEGFARKETERSAATNDLLGKVPYLNGGLFLRHQIEELRGRDIEIPDRAFERVFGFFEEYQWHLDERPRRADNEINPDVLGYIFEKYINQKQMGAYYTKEDITGYISQNTVIPFLFDAAREKCKIAFEGDHSVWQLLRADPDRYIYDAVKHGIWEDPSSVAAVYDLRLDPDTSSVAALCERRPAVTDRRYRELPPEIAAGLDDVSKRTEWNKPTPPEYALPTEIWREVVARRKRYEEVRSKLAAGEVRSINDLITYNLDIRQFAQDVIENCEGPELLRAFYHAIEQVTVLDPACGSGAFLFAALNILEPLYEACLDRMESFLEDLERSGEKHRPEKFSDFRKVLERVALHPNRRYFILKSIILKNLNGVDIMEEATEICKLRLFLKLVAQIDAVERIEPLPDIDFNIRAGNTLVGYATYDDVKRAVSGKLDFEGKMAQIEEKAEEVEELFTQFRLQQTEIGGEVTADDKAELRRRLKVLEDELNEYLAGEYGVKVSDKTAYPRWLVSHKPFHWFIEFYSILRDGGFDAIIGNPPYVVYPSSSVIYVVRGYSTTEAKNLYALFYERSVGLGRPESKIGLIVQLTAICSERMNVLQEFLVPRGTLVIVPFPRRPESVFDGVEMPVVIVLLNQGLANGFRTTKINRFYSNERSCAAAKLAFTEHQIRLAGHRIPKVGTSLELYVLGKLVHGSSVLASLTCKKSNWPLYYQEACRYWAKAIYGVPYFRRNKQRIDPPHGRFLYFETSEACAFGSCLANSSLFYWYYSLCCDCEHINDSFLRAFPIPSDWSTSRWGALARELVDSLNAHATRKVISTKQGHTIEYDEIKAAYSKPIMDEIDSVLARHYGFNDEELDFIINYDIKYRMGREGAEDE